MGIKHLNEVEKFLKKNKGESFTKTAIASAIEPRMSWYTLVETINYLLREGKIERVRKLGALDTYKYKEGKK